MNTSKTVLVVDYDKTVRTTLSITIKDMGLTVYEAHDGVTAMEIVKSNAIDLVITNLLLSTLGGIDFIKSVQMTHGHTEIIVISDIVNSAILERMRKLGVFRVFQIPFKLDEIKDAVLRGTASVRIDRLNASDPNTSCIPQNFLRFIAAHPDNEITQQVHRICASRGYAVDAAATPSELLKFLTLGSYDVIVTTERMLKKVNMKELQQVFSGVCKPVLFMLTPIPDKPAKPFNTLSPYTFYLSPSFMDDTLLSKLQSILPNYIDSRERSTLDWETRKRSKRSIVSHLHYKNFHPQKVFRPIVAFYFIMIILAGLIGFWVSNLIETKPKENITTKEMELLRNLEQYEKLEKLKKLRRE